MKILKNKLKSELNLRTERNFPIRGIEFIDINPLVIQKEVFNEIITLFTEEIKNKNVDYIISPEARGFFFGCPAAIALGAGFVPVRKPGKLPRETISKKYDLEYGSNEIHMHKDSIKKGQRVLIVDDLLATGGTIEATIELIEQMGGIVAGIAFVVELKDLNAAEHLRAKGYDVFSIVTY